MSDMATADEAGIVPEITRERRDVVWRDLEVLAVQRVTPQMVRVTLGGPDLAGFASTGFDDHVKLAMGGSIEAGGSRDDWREFTPRRYDARSLDIDFALHGKGLASDWAKTVVPGARLLVGGPRGSRIIGGPVDHWVLIGDETALPAIGRFLEEAPDGLRVSVVGLVAGADEEQSFDTRANAAIRWIHRPLDAAADPAPALAALEGLDLQPTSFVWIAAEAGVSHALRAALSDAGHPDAWLTAKGYWQSV